MKDNIDLSRRQFLHGKKRRYDSMLPPWANAEFFDLCDRCDKCVNACEEQILIRGDGGFPNVSFTETGCTFCQDCLIVCPTGALKENCPGKRNAWQHQVSISSDCLALNGITCRSCADACEESAIRFSLRLGGRAIPEINDDICTACGVCIAVCPVKVITVTRDSEHGG